jgi:hypothetical protein
VSSSSISLTGYLLGVLAAFRGHSQVLGKQETGDALRRAVVPVWT